MNVFNQVLFFAAAQDFGVVVEVNAHVSIVELHANAVLFAEVDPLHYPDQLRPIFVTLFDRLRVGVRIITSLLFWVRLQFWSNLQF